MRLRIEIPNKKKKMFLKIFGEIKLNYLLLLLLLLLSYLPMFKCQINCLL